jgi:hypothetical protein
MEGKVEINGYGGMPGIPVVLRRVPVPERCAEM